MTRFILICLCTLFFTTAAQAQGGAEIDATLAEQQKAITAQAEALEAHEKALGERAEIDRVIGEQIIELTKKVDELAAAIDNPQPEPEPEPEPTKPLPLHLVTADLTTPIKGDIEIDGPFSLCAFDSDGVRGPVAFYVDGANYRTESQGAYCLAGGNEGPFPLIELPAGNHAIEVTGPNFDPVSFILTVTNNAPQPPPVDPDAEPMVQVGTWYPQPFNIEEPFLNYFRQSGMEWTAGAIRDGDIVLVAEKTTQDLLDGGFVSQETGLPIALPDGRALTSVVYFTGKDMGHWDGEWVLEWDGDADLSLLFMPKELMTQVSPNRIEFRRDYVNGLTPYHAAIQVKRLNSLTDIRLFRKENEQALRAGKFFNPRFTDEVKPYHVVRSMDLQETNRSAIRSVDDLATLDTQFWGNIAYIPGGAIRPTKRSAPLEAIFALATESDTELWTHVPITLGAPLDIFDAFDEDFGTWAGNYRRMARENTSAILASPEWDRYADHFVDALINSGYPSDRPLYVTISNEVWNFAGQYFLTTQYAWGLGEGSGIVGGYNRTGYGFASARWKLALDKALAKAGREQDVIYLLEGQAVNPATTRDALKAAKAYMEDAGEDWSKHAGDFGISVASYWGSHDFNKLGIDPNDLNALENWHINGPDNHVATLNAVVKYFTEHQQAGAAYGVPLIGAYEGGSHFNKPPEMSRESYDAFIWGEYGGRINKAVNDALAAKFPGIILSNYVLAGPQDDAWFEGPLGVENPYADSWKAYQRGQ